jgi:adenosylhomocysteine nucleosidase
MKTLILIALPSEAPNLRHMMNVFYTGVGKVNAALTAAQVIERYEPDRIINIGTAGGITVGPGLHECTKFVQRDITCQALGCFDGQTPFEDDIILTTGTNGLTCSTGDNFVMNPQLSIPADVVDMEAYAIAKACLRYKIEFRCFKYITDQADTQAHDSWKQSVSMGEKFFIAKLLELGISV